MRLIAASILLLSLHIQAQDFTAVLKSIEARSTHLSALRLETASDQAEARLGYLPEGPSMSVGYLFGIGKSDAKVNISVEQPLDLPTTYAAKRRMAREASRVAALRYLDQRRQLLVTAHKLCIEVVYCNAMMEHLNEDLERMRALSDAYNTLYEQGEATSIDHNKAHQAVLLFDAEYREFMTMKENLLAELACLNGGEPVCIVDSAFAPVPPMEGDFDAWLQAHLQSYPTLQLAQGEADREKAAVTVAKREQLPGLTVGAAAEIGREEKIVGPTVGLTLPAWGARRRVKVAETRLAARQMEAEDVRLHLITQLQSTHREALELQETNRQLTHHLTHCDNGELLRKSLEAGQITLLTYLQELQFVHEMHEKHLATERDLALRLAELNPFQ